ncbi:MAG: type IV pilus secretin PilQ [Terriglobales bacterium]
MRKQLLGLIVPLLAFVVIASAADMTGKGAAAGAQLERLEVAHSQDGLRVEFKAKGSLAPRLTTLDSPPRLVIDLPNTVMATRQSHVVVDEGGVRDIRIGMDGQRNTRIVVDLAATCRHELVAGSDSSFVLKIGAPSADRRSAADDKPAAGAAPKLVLASETITAPALTPLPATSNVPATPAEAAPAATPATTVPAGKPADFAIVEPKYSVKTDNAGAPAEKAQTAADRFADKTASQLIATNTNATMQGAPQPIQPAVNLAAEQKEQMAQKPATANSAKYTGEPISVNLKDVDLKDFFRLIHEISGLNVVLDPNIHGTLTIVLDDVPWDQALDIVLKNNGLSRQLDGNVLRIATLETLKHEAEARRGQIDAEALAVDKVTITRFLSYAHAKDVLPTIRKFLSQRGDLVADERTNSLIVSDIPAVLPQIDRIIQQMDRKTQEVEIEARVVAATRSFARDIGTQLGFGWGNGTTQVGGVPSSTNSSPFINTNAGNPLYPTNATGIIPLFSNLGATGPTSGIGFSTGTNTMRLDFALTMSEQRGLLKILSRPRVVTQNNIQAVVKQGVRIPIESAAALGTPATITYVDAFLRLTVTPQITSEGTIFLNVDVENTLPDFSNSINGNPTLITQQATTQVLVTDGGTVVIGGVIQTNNSLNVQQVPLLGDIPYLGNLFKHRSVSTTTQELIFFITPRIVQT